MKLSSHILAGMTLKKSVAGANREKHPGRTKQHPNLHT